MFAVVLILHAHFECEEKFSGRFCYVVEKKRKEKKTLPERWVSIKDTELIHQSQVFSNSGHLFRNGQESQAFAVSLFVINSLGVLCPN